VLYKFDLTYFSLIFDTVRYFLLIIFIYTCANIMEQRRFNCVETDTRNALQRTCPVCNNLFQASTELCDRRPLVACVNGDTVCADCCSEFRKRPDGKCPVCGDDLLPKSIVNRVLNELIANCVSVLKISVRDIDMSKEPFAYGAFGRVYMAK